jgi:PhzF family phenazine biosynthesis protein
MSITTPIYQVDSFTAEPFHGNPAGVCLLREDADPSWMQAVAAEMNLSETAFVKRRANSDFSIRWFTPTVEVPLCGHATLASAHILWEEDLVPCEKPITFHGQEELLTARREADWICLDFPALPVEESTAPVGLSDAFHCRPVSIHRNRFGTYLLELDSEKTVRELRPDFGRLRDSACDACIATARSDSDSCDFVSRFFGPGMGLDEDPVTGAAHCSLTPYWAERLEKSELVGHQVSKRGGVVRVRLRGDRVDLLGQALTVMQGEMLQ